MRWIFWLLAIVLSAAAGYWVYRKDRQRAVPYPWLTAALRSIVVFLTLLLLLVPVFTITSNQTQKPIVLLLQDDSRSIATALGKDSTTYRKNIQDLTSRLSGKYKVVTWAFGNTIQSDSLFRYHQPATDISAALARAQEFYGLQNLGAVILATDGRFNQGANPLYQQLSLQSPLYTVAIGDSAQQKDIRISQVYANKVVSLNSQFEIRADVVAALCNGYNGNVHLQEAGNDLSTAPLDINADKYDRAVSFTVKASVAGLHHYILTIPSAEGETNTANNRKDVFVEVADEKKNILIVSAAPHPDVNAINEALNGLENYKVTIRTADNMPSSLSDYQVVILHGLPSQDNDLSQWGNINKPVWYILNSKINVFELNRLQHIATFNLAAPHDEVPGLNTSFNIFTVPQNVQSVLDKMPPLSVPVANIKAAPNASVLLSHNNGATQEPLWILQQGATPAALLTGEGLWRWRLYEYKNFNEHNVIDELIRQTVTFLSANSNEKPFQVVLPKYIWSDEEAISFNAYLLNANNEQVNTPDVQLTIFDSSGRKQNFSFEKSGNAYSLNMGVWAGDTYTYTAHTSYNGKTYTANGSFVVQSMPLEAMQTGADYPLLYGVAHKYGGSLVPAANVASLYDSITRNENIKPVIQTDTETIPLVNLKWYFFLILLFAVTEWLLRKYWLAQ